MERIVYDADGGARPAPLVVPRAARGACRVDPPRASSRRRTPRFSRSAAAPGTIWRCSASSARSTRSSSTTRRAAVAEQRLGRPVMSSPLPELTRSRRAALRPDRRVRRDRAYRRRPRRAGLDRHAAEAGRQAGRDRSRPPVDVVGARRRQPPPAPLFEARAAAADRGFAAEARSASAISTACCSRWRSRERHGVEACRGKDDGDLKLPPAPLNRALEAASPPSVT